MGEGIHGIENAYVSTGGVSSRLVEYVAPKAETPMGAENCLGGG